jgi:hypothetical protein
MCRVATTIMGVAAVAGLAGFASGFVSTSKQSIEGVWRPVEIRMSGPAAQTITPDQPSLDVITSKHYSRVEIHAPGPRPNVVDAAKATADELRQAWGPVIAEAGSYELRDNIIRMRPLVAKNAAVMAPGVVLENEVRLAGDTLWLTLRRDVRGAVANPPTIKLVRVE